MFPSWWDNDNSTAGETIRNPHFGQIMTTRFEETNYIINQLQGNFEKMSCQDENLA